MKRRPHHQVDIAAGVGSNKELPAPEPERTQALVSQLEHLLRTHGDEEALTEQSCLQDVVAKLRHLATTWGSILWLPWRGQTRFHVSHRVSRPSIHGSEGTAVPPAVR
jgi:hypothetical protein